MTPQSALVKHDPDNGTWGDCQRICIAAILDMPAADVPHFCDKDNPGWHADMIAWLARRGLAYTQLGYAGDVPLEQIYEWTTKANPGVPMILQGRSSLGCNHVVVIQDGEIICDSSGNGIVGPNSDGIWQLELLTIGNDWGRRAGAAYTLGGLVMDAIGDLTDPAAADSTVRFDFALEPFAMTVRRDLEDAGPDDFPTRKHEDSAAINARLAAIADMVVPAYRAEGARYSCTGHIAHQWNAAYEGAARALGAEIVLSSIKSGEPPALGNGLGDRI